MNYENAFTCITNFVAQVIFTIYNKINKLGRNTLIKKTLVIKNITKTYIFSE